MDLTGNRVGRVPGDREGGIEYGGDVGRVAEQVKGSTSPNIRKMNARLVLCAMSRITVSLVQPGGIRGNIPGSSNPPGAER